jgi:hypothetical protein
MSKSDKALVSPYRQRIAELMEKAKPLADDLDLIALELRDIETVELRRLANEVEPYGPRWIKLLGLVDPSNALHELLQQAGVLQEVDRIEAVRRRRDTPRADQPATEADAPWETLREMRQFIELVAVDPTAIDSISEATGLDGREAIIQALCAEVVTVECRVVELHGELATLKDAMISLGGLSAGLLGLPLRPDEPDSDEPDSEVLALHKALHRHGAAIRDAVGLPRLSHAVDKGDAASGD